MEKIVVKSEYFCIVQTLTCGQVFRYKPYKKGYTVFSGDKICYVYTENENTVIETEFKDYFYNYFDLNTDYKRIVDSAFSENVEVLKVSAKLAKGIRILKQNPEETLFSFIISQNNNIKRITSTIEKTCEKVGKKLNSPFGEYYAFPTATEFLSLKDDDYKALGYGYRGAYIKNLANLIVNGYSVTSLNSLTTPELKQELLKLYGVGEKVALCVTLFGFSRTDSFPVDTWIEKIYRENMGGTLKSRTEITKFFTSKFGAYGGYYQQYLFYYKRSLEKR
ncbi:MAG: DNA-3-methyladenine glycosylase 2 family protein [Clostridia bacterium]|nr:DNA-3-methyladenine glycosylase 2 family protein [Clostridia bacterium]